MPKPKVYMYRYRPVETDLAIATSLSGNEALGAGRSAPNIKYVFVVHLILKSASLNSTSCNWPLPLSSSTSSGHSHVKFSVELNETDWITDN